MLPNRYAPLVSWASLVVIVLMLQVDTIATAQALYHLYKQIAIFVIVSLPCDVVIAWNS